jgi:hypothetical protein
LSARSDCPNIGHNRYLVTAVVRDLIEAIDGRCTPLFAAPLPIMPEAQITSGLPMNRTRSP